MITEQITTTITDPVLSRTNPFVVSQRSIAIPAKIRTLHIKIGTKTRLRISLIKLSPINVELMVAIRNYRIPSLSHNTQMRPKPPCLVDPGKIQQL